MELLSEIESLFTGREPVVLSL